MVINGEEYIENLIIENFWEQQLSHFLSEDDPLFDEYRTDSFLEQDRTNQLEDQNAQSLKKVDGYSYVLFLEAQFLVDDMRLDKQIRERNKQRAEEINKARDNQMNNQRFIKNDKDSLKHIKANAYTVFEGLFPYRDVPVEEVDQIVEDVAQSYASLEVINAANLGEIFEKVIDEFERRWNDQENITNKVIDFGKKEKPKGNHARKRIDQWERKLDWSDEGPLDL